jgi:hypothetical protein
MNKLYTENEMDDVKTVIHEREVEIEDLNLSINKARDAIDALES